MISILATGFSAALATEGLWLLMGVVLVAGAVRGFTGFGTAMVFMPFAAAVLPPVWALIVMLVFDIAGIPPLVPRALKDADRGDLILLSLGVVIAAPVGIVMLSRFESDAFSWVLAVIVLLLLAALASGWRYHGQLHRWAVSLIGSLGGFLAGLSGLAGPPVILFYMSRPLPVRVIRANILLFLVLADILTLLALAVAGLLEATPLAIGVLMILPYIAGGLIGAALFNPAYEKLYRLIAYGLIFAAAVVNLPIFR